MQLQVLSHLNLPSPTSQYVLISHQDEQKSVVCTNLTHSMILQIQLLQKCSGAVHSSNATCLQTLCMYYAAVHFVHMYLCAVCQSGEA